VKNRKLNISGDSNYIYFYLTSSNLIILIEIMIPRIVSRKIAMYNFPCVLFSIVSARHRNHFSDASLEKDKNYKKIIEDQISID
jgi:hypothetical protein